MEKRPPKRPPRRMRRKKKTMDNSMQHKQQRDVLAFLGGEFLCSSAR